MDNDTPRPGPAPPPRGRPRPTIDLEATEIPSGAPPHAAVGPDRMPPLWLRLWRRWRGLATDWSRHDLPRPPIAAAIGGAAIVLVILLMTGLLSGRDAAHEALAGRLTAAEQKIQEIAARPALATADPATVDALSSRVARIEQAIAAPRAPGTDPALANRLAMLESNLKALDDQIAAVARRDDDIGSIARDARSRAEAAAAAVAGLKSAPAGAAPATGGTLDALINRVAALEASTKTLQTELNRRSTETPDYSARLATAANLLKSAVERGEPFVAELTAAKTQARDPKVLAPLEAFAASGVPTETALAQEFARLAPAITKAAGGPPRDAPFLERLQSNAGKLVRIRRADEPAGDDPDAIIVRAETRVRAGDFASALAELEKLAPAARAPAQAWIAKAQARAAALAASRQFATEALAALGER